MKSLFLFIICVFLLATPVWAATADFVYDAHDQRDPFLPLVSAGGAIISYESNVSASDMALEGIIADGTSRAAILNGSIVEVGGTIGAYKVVSIEEDAVVLDKDGQQSVIRLKREE